MSYYDPYPMTPLERPLCLIGFMGSEIHSIAYFITSLTGLPFVELDKLVEHQAGMSLGQLYLEQGESTWRKLESQQLKVALQMKPARLICLGDGSLLSKENCIQVLEQAHLVYLRRPHQGVLERIRKGRQENIQRFPLLLTHPLKHITEITSLLSQREPSYEQAHTLIDLGESTPLFAAQSVIKRLKLL